MEKTFRKGKGLRQETRKVAIFAKKNHTDKDYYFRKDKAAKKIEVEDKVSFLITNTNEEIQE